MHEEARGQNDRLAVTASTVPSADPAALEVAYQEARLTLESQMAWLQDMRGRSVALVGVGSGLASLAAGTVAFLAERSTPDADALTIGALLGAALALLGLVGLAAAILTRTSLETGIDTRQMLSWIVYAGFDRALVHREAAVQLSGAADRNRGRLGRRAQFLSAAVVCLGVEVVLLPITIWSYVT
jgi:hypothetical protein